MKARIKNFFFFFPTYLITGATRILPGPHHRQNSTPTANAGCWILSRRQTTSPVPYRRQGLNRSWTPVAPTTGHIESHTVPNKQRLGMRGRQLVLQRLGEIDALNQLVEQEARSQNHYRILHQPGRLRYKRQPRKRGWPKKLTRRRERKPLVNDSRKLIAHFYNT